MKNSARLPVQARLKSTGLSVGELARLAGVAASAVRYYEGIGMLPEPARISGRRVYDVADAERLKRIVAARTLGFSIRDLKAMAVMDAGALRRAAGERAEALRQQIAGLQASASRLEALSQCACEAGGACGL